MEIRKEILDILTKDAKIANRHIAAMLGIEEAKVAEEIKAMEAVSYTHLRRGTAFRFFQIKGRGAKPGRRGRRKHGTDV